MKQNLFSFLKTRHHLSGDNRQTNLTHTWTGKQNLACTGRRVFPPNLCQLLGLMSRYHPRYSTAGVTLPLDPFWSCMGDIAASKPPAPKGTDLAASGPMEEHPPHVPFSPHPDTAEKKTPSCPFLLNGSLEWGVILARENEILQGEESKKRKKGQK